MAVPKYARRIARLPEVLERLAAHPDGIPLVELAERIGVPPDELREDLLAFYTADVGDLADLMFGLSRPDVLEFVGPDGDDVDPNTAEIVRIVDERPTEELGVEYVDAAELALIHTAARLLLELEPDDQDLADALDVLTETMFGTPPDDPSDGSGGGQSDPALITLREGIEQRRRVVITYSRSWEQGVFSRPVDPYRLVQTRRGWEVDAGPPDDQGRIRTYLLSNLRHVRLTQESFEAPDDLARLLAEQRATTRVRVRLPHAARWAADFYAEVVTNVADDEETSTLDLDLLPPVDDRVGLLLLVAGGDAQELDPPGLVSAGPELARRLLEHHRSTQGSAQ